jgi:hypothetical protein
MHPLNFLNPLNPNLQPNLPKVPKPPRYRKITTNNDTLYYKQRIILELYLQ